MSIEPITAWCWGPLSFVLVSFIVTDNPFRHPLQIIISSRQFYGDVLYYGTFMFDFLVCRVEYSRPEGYYFYRYFVLLNGFWIVIQGCKWVFHFFFPSRLVSENRANGYSACC